MSDAGLLQRITVNPAIFDGKPIIRGDGWPWSMSSGFSLPGTRRRRSWRAILGSNRRIYALALHTRTAWLLTSGSSPQWWALRRGHSRAARVHASKRSDRYRLVESGTRAGSSRTRTA